MQNPSRKTIIKQRRKRITLATFVIILLIAMLSAGVLAMYLNLPTKHQLEQTTFRQLSLTHQQHIKNQIATQEAQFAEGITTNTPEADTFSLTATALIGQVTIDAKQLELFQSRTPDNFDLTATALIGQITTEALTPSPTFPPYEALVDIWTLDIENALGFSHSIVKQVVIDLTFGYKKNRSQINATYFNGNIERIETDKSSYVALRVETNVGFQNNDRFLIFKIDDDNVKLIFDSVVGDGCFLKPPFGNAFFDMNQNNKINIGIAHSIGANCRESQLMILEITHESVNDISPKENEQPDGEYSRFSLKDINDDDIIDVIFPVYNAYKAGHPNDCTPSDRELLYKWNGKRYALAN